MSAPGGTTLPQGWTKLKGSAPPSALATTAPQMTTTAWTRRVVGPSALPAPLQFFARHRLGVASGRSPTARTRRSPWLPGAAGLPRALSPGGLSEAAALFGRREPSQAMSDTRYRVVDPRSCAISRTCPAPISGVPVRMRKASRHQREARTVDGSEAKGDGPRCPSPAR